MITILNLWLLFKWSTDRDIEFLWAFKTAGDLLNIPTSQQQTQLVQLYGLFRSANSSYTLP